ncbi:hypothetical protein Tco_1119319 [Tanacetum coccineum]
MASDGSDPDVEYALSRLLQRGTVAEYQNEFEMLISRVTRKSESLLQTIYIFGLKPAQQCSLLRSNPKTLDEAFSLARATKARFTNLQLLKILKSNHSTLGEAFFKAHVIEARFEDEWSTTDITITNDLNAGVQRASDLADQRPATTSATPTSSILTIGGYQNKASDSFTTPEVAREAALEVAPEAVRETTTAADTVAKIEETGEFTLQN